MTIEPSTQLGRLERVNLREAWASEPGDFTPWLAEADNLKLIGEILEMDLELEALEKGVGPFRADILCKDAGSDTCVLIENQLEYTDHTHLGQILTYAAGLDAVTIVWIAGRFVEQHRAALDWLNEMTPEGIGFFGLEVELWRIGESAPAPKFNVVSRPNEWTRTVKRNTGSNPELASLCQEYWSGVIEALGPFDILHAGAKPVRKRDIRFPVGWKDFWLKAYFSSVNESCGIWIACRSPQFAEHFAVLEDSKTEIEKRIGESLNWNLKEDGASVGYDCAKGDASDRADWPRQHALIAQRVNALYQAVAPFVERLDGQNSEV